jgi:hypothetical protein
MLTKLGILFIGLTVGGAAFLMTGLAAFLLVSQIQDATLLAQATQPVQPNQVLASNRPVIVVHYAEYAPPPE